MSILIRLQSLVKTPKNILLIGLMVLILGASIGFLVGHYLYNSDKQIIQENKKAADPDSVVIHLASPKPDQQFVKEDELVSPEDDLLEYFAKKYQGLSDEIPQGMPLTDDGSNYVYEMDLSGIDKKSIEVRIEGGQLFVSYQKESMSQSQNGFSKQSSRSQTIQSLPGDAEGIHSQISQEGGKLFVKIPHR